MAEKAAARAGGVAGALPALTRARLFALAARAEVESRLVVRSPEGRWSVRDGPLPRRALPALAQPGWTLLVQGVDLHDEAAHALLQRFRFAGDARLDDLMVSYASDGGGVGPHVDSYDVFLLQLRGSRRWRVGRPGGAALRADVPLKMLTRLDACHEWRLDAGDMLYLPPGWGHDGVAEGACLTASIGFRSPAPRELEVALVERIADALQTQGGASAGAAPRDAAAAPLRDAGVPPAAHPARIPASLQRHADAALRRVADGAAARRALGEMLSEPKADVWFEADSRSDAGTRTGAVVVDRRSRMLYDARHLFFNGESFAATGADRALLVRLADRRRLEAAERARLGAPGRALLAEWLAAGWLRLETAASAE